MSATTTTIDDEDVSAQADAENDVDEQSTLEKDELFHLLKSERRRRALRYLLDAESEPVRMRTLAEAVAAEEYDKSVDQLHTDERQRVYITLYQSHLPQLDRAGVIDYNQSRGQITTTPLIDEFEDYLETTTRTESSSSTNDSLVPALSGFGGGGMVAILLQAAGVASTFVVGVLAVAMLSALAISTR
ncbi:hypothetical protein HWV07_10415 [Natronomonas salina]|uniref:DUF7344 domain-containing protein n=1 Tax=Natronomonas salina TaxID=1710540 RepID=UPI0015B458A6|nr:hypothetical protein [Natronomonas salina]QLD89419.1 hypothetical protein HWV07_10415 [Natronomonas salina]